jgi:hypothetical protein
VLWRSVKRVQKLVAVAKARRKFGKAEETERSSLEAWKLLPSNGSEDVTVGTSLCVTVICKFTVTSCE